MKKFTHFLEVFIFGARWLLAPLYIGLVGALALLVFRYGKEFVTLASNINESDNHVFTLDLLGLLDRADAGSYTLTYSLRGPVAAAGIDLAGTPTTAACPAFAYTPERSATVLEKLIAAGAVFDQADGQIALTREGGHAVRRIAACGSLHSIGAAFCKSGAQRMCEEANRDQRAKATVNRVENRHRVPAGFYTDKDAA